MVLDLVLTDHGLGQPYLTSSAITDEECGVEFCQENLTNPGSDWSNPGPRNESIKGTLMP